MNNFSIWEQLPAEGPSAFCGQTPNTQADFYIIRGYFRTYMIPETIDISIVWHHAPPGYVYNDKRAGIIAGMTVVMLIMIGITTARLLARILGKNTVFGLDDYVIIPAAALAIAYPVLQILGVVKGGAGRHSWDNTYEDLYNFYYYLDTCTKLYYADVALVKISIALFVRRLANHASRGWRMATDVFLVTVVGHLVACLLANILLCDPPRAGWDLKFAGRLETAARCEWWTTRFKILHSIHVAQSMMLLMTPVVILWKVQMDTAKKIRLFVIWVVGATSVLGGLIQLLLGAMGDDDDVFMAYTTILQWTVLDLSMGVVVASLPVLDTVLIGGWRRATSRIARLRGKFKDSSSNLETGGRGSSSSTPGGAGSQDRTLLGGGGGRGGGDSSPTSRHRLSSIPDQFEPIEAVLLPIDAARLGTDKECASYEMPNLSPRETADTGVELGETPNKEK
ncbi:hypothetical protein PgNI_05923 [Pyricularia grisea]|uniref:Rhodopsin domain-containing protein n=1 Tax=Pyricularia grisea TaxID=148305 RepID=A0A6P8B4X0_PYRGI|nr:hypothetical protein PgNI_05923 [Pyricularia grisea]TLD10305.1 hypothetical protein PgNI_05923 [Pyricularia grisea]